MLKPILESTRLDGLNGEFSETKPKDIHTQKCLIGNGNENTIDTAEPNRPVHFNKGLNLLLYKNLMELSYNPINRNDHFNQTNCLYRVRFDLSLWQPIKDVIGHRDARGETGRKFWTAGRWRCTMRFGGFPAYWGKYFFFEKIVRFIFKKWLLFVFYLSKCCIYQEIVCRASVQIND
jgi:hypothetical protein